MHRVFCPNCKDDHSPSTVLRIRGNSFSISVIIRRRFGNNLTRRSLDSYHLIVHRRDKEPNKTSQSLNQEIPEYTTHVVFKVFFIILPTHGKLKVVVMLVGTLVACPMVQVSN